MIVAGLVALVEGPPTYNEASELQVHTDLEGDPYLRPIRNFEVYFTAVFLFRHERKIFCSWKGAQKAFRGQGVGLILEAITALPIPYHPFLLLLRLQ